MKRKIIFVLVILLFFGFVVINCNAQSSTNDQRIVGTWIATENYNDEVETITCVFNANGSGAFTYTYLKDTKNNRSYTFTYCVSITGKLVTREGKKTSGEGRDSFSLEGELAFSPDGKIMVIGDYARVYRKK